MSLNINAIKDLLINKFPNSKVSIVDTAGDGHHFEATIVSDLFLNKSNVQRHQMVYEALGTLVGNEMHALSIDTKTFSEDTNNINNHENTSTNLYNDTLKKIDKVIKNYDIVLFMKGTKDAPMCGFSSFVCQVLLSLGVHFEDVNVLSSEEIRENIKIYSNWPTIPQLYIKGKFIGGADIVREMYENNQLQNLLTAHNLMG